ncbi:MAG TPA: hypothetical protein VFZ53_14990 [Polyangiaceae bacterium]
MTEGSGESAGSELQFDKVEHASPGASRTCPICQKIVSDEYYEVNGNVICPSCAHDLAGGKGGAPLLRAALFGGGAAVVSTLGWYLIIKATDREWGLVAIAVGFFVGMAVRRGSRVGGGFRYQALAMALTYSSITVSHVPWVIDGFRQAEAERTAPAAGQGRPDGEASRKVEGVPEEPPSLGNFVFAWIFVLGVAMVSPFLAGVDGIMGLIIIGIALYEAWKLNRQVLVNGPFRLSTVPAVT